MNTSPNTSPNAGHGASPDLSVGVFLPTFQTAEAQPGKAIAAFARRAEELGYDSLWATDHLLHASRFYRVPWLDPLTALTYAAAVTDRVALGTSVLVVPVRHPVVLAKQIASLQAVSGDRFVFGVGTGWDAREFEAVGVRKAERGARTDEAVHLIRELLTGRPVTYDGRFYRLDDVRIGPTPGRQTPIWVAGGRQLEHDRSPEKPVMAPRVLRRIGRADGWIARPTAPVEAIAADADEITAQLAGQGRTAEGFTFAHENFLHLVATDDPVRTRAAQVERFTAVMGDGRPFEYFEKVYLTGTVPEVVAKLRDRVATGVSHLLLHTLEPSVDQLELWAERLLPALRGEA